jgi:hypothetical protein
LAVINKKLTNLKVIFSALLFQKLHHIKADFFIDRLNMKNKLYLVFIIHLLLLSFSCTTKKGETTKLGKFYHNVTGRYNAYYNADLLLQKGFETQTQMHRDNYNEILHLFPYAAGEKPTVSAAQANKNPTVDPATDPKSGPLKNNSTGSQPNAAAAGSPLDNAIKKCAINIELHRPSNWADDSYFIIGRAEFLKKEFEKSAATFKYITEKYHTNKAISEMSPDELKAYNREQQKKNAKKNKKKKKKPVKKKKKSVKKKKKKPVKTPKTVELNKNTEEEEDSKPPKYFLKHRPVRYDAMLWLAKSYIESDNYDEAGRYLRLLTEKSDVPRKIKAQAFTVIAYGHIRQKEFDKAIEPLEEGISMIRRRKNKIRFIYVLAQLYQKQGNNQLAMEYFRKVPKANPPYEMEFNARLNMAINAAGAENSKFDPENLLKRMLRDGKNEEYKDQIYFALAKMQLNSGNKESGIVALQMAMQNADDFQKTEASYMLAELFWERKDYVMAYAYFDTCSMSILAVDERSSYVSSQKLLLKDLAENINTITLKDSLLSIAAMPFDKQKELVQKLRTEEDAAKKPQSALDRNAAKTKAATDAGINPSAVTNSKFPLYDPNVSKKGERDFQKRWGDRVWTDNWRRSSTEGKNGNEGAGTADALKPLTESEVKEYLKKMGVPQDSAALKKMNGEIETALFLVGNIYYEKLDENKRASDAIDKLFARYPKTKHELEAWFLMFNICNEDKNNSCAALYKDKILSAYADSDIAKSIKDPNYLNAKQRQIAEANKYYDETYALIKSGNYQDAYRRYEGLPKKYGNNYPLKARFAILAAMCIGGMQGQDQYISALKSVSVSFPNTEEDKKAKEMVALLQGNKTDNKIVTPQPVNSDSKELKGNYNFDNDVNTGHYILVAFDDAKTNLNDLKGKIADFNNKTFSLLRLNVSSLMLDGKSPTLIVRKFKDRAESQEYLKTAEGNPDFMGKDVPAHKIYFIGQNNYREILQKQNFGDYVKFYEENYK